MRLTLRTLLAYLCGLLEPEDAQEIKRKVSQPGRGQQLAERIPKLVAKRELEAPRLDAKAAGADPNIVANYLDGILTPARTAEFDRVCLQSDRQLAEVASCFEILSVVQRPIKVSAGLRQSIYRVVDTVAKHDAASRSEIPPQVLESQYELSEDDRAAILEEYVDAPILKPASSDRPRPADESIRDTTSIDPTESAKRSPTARPSKRPWREEEVPASASSMAGAPVDEPSEETETDDELVISADKNWFESDLESFLKNRNESGSAVDEFGAEIETPHRADPKSARPANVVKPTVFAHDDSEPVEAPPIDDGRVIPQGSGDEAVAIQVQTVAPANSNRDAMAQSQKGGTNLRRWIPVIAVAVVALVLGGVLFVVLGGPQLLVGANDQTKDPNQSSETSEADDSSESADESVDAERRDASSIDGDEPDQPRTSPLDSEQEDRSSLAQSNPDSPDGRRLDDEAPIPTPAPDKALDDGFPVLKLPDDLTGEDSPGDEGPASIELPDPNAPLGKLSSRSTVLARFDELRNAWLRVPDEGAIQRVDRLLNFPSYHSQIQFGDSVQVTLNGSAGLEVLGVVQERPQLALRFGKMSALALNKPNAEINLQVDQINARITLVEKDSRIAVRRLAFLPPGADPIAAGSQVVVDVVAVQGRVIWEDANGPKIMDAGQARRYVGGSAEEVVTLPSIPYWIDSQVADIDRRGSESVAGLVPADQPLNNAFRQLVEDSHVEIRMLAVQCLSLLGEHESVIEALANDRNKSYWTDTIEWLRGLLARGPAQAEAVYAGIQKANPDNAAIIYRLLVGFSEGQVIGGADAELIDLLESDDLMLRVLAADNLLRITGSRGMYRPETSERIRESHVRTWRKQLDQGAIRYSQPPTLPTINGSRMGE